MKKISKREMKFEFLRLMELALDPKGRLDMEVFAKHLATRLEFSIADVDGLIKVLKGMKKEK